MPGIGLESATLAHPRPSRRLSGDRGVAGRRAILQPGNDLFFVYTHNWRELELERFATLDRRAVSKIADTHRF